MNIFIYDYPYNDNVPNFRENNIANMIDNHLAKLNSDTIRFSLALQTGRWHATEDIHLLEKIPTHEQFLYTMNLGLLYGAKGICISNYFYSDAGADNTSALCSFDTSETSFVEQDLWYFIKDTVSPRLKGLFGRTIKGLEQKGQLPKIEVQTEPGPTLNTNYFLTKVEKWGTSGNAVDTFFVDLGFFEKANSDKRYFMAVNRYYSNLSKIKYTFKDLTSYKNWEVTNFVTNTKTTVVTNVSNMATYNDVLPIGDAGLYSVLPVAKYGGTLTGNETLTGTNTLLGEMTVQSGATLTINGTYNIYGNITVNSGGNIVLNSGTLNFNNGTSLTVNGTLTATDVTFNRGGTTGKWGSLKFDGAGASSSVLNRGNIYNAANVQVLNNANVTIQNSLIQDCTQGIYVYNASPQILNNRITNPSLHGIYVDALNKNPLIKDNTIIKTSSNANYKHQEGIILYNGTIGYIAHNDISGFDHGIYLGGGVNASFSDYSSQILSPNNRMKGNRYGVMVGWGSYLVGGIFDEGLNNTISSNDSYNIFVYEYSTVYAQYNYWGTGSLKQYVDGKSYLSALPRLSNDPWLNQNASQNIALGNAESFGIRQLSTTIESAKVTKDIYQEDKKGETKNDLNAAKEEDEFLKALLLEKEGKIDEAIKQLKAAVNNKKYSRYAITELGGIKERFGKETIQVYFEDLLKDPSEGNKSKIKKHLAAFYLNNNEDAKATAIFDELKDDKNSKKDNFEGLLDKFNFMLHKKKDVKSAAELLAEMQKKFGTDEEAMIHIETAEMLINGDHNFAFGKKQNKLETSIEIEAPKEYALFNNFPNPFNPVTTITYQLPKDGFVTLKIYDILGNEVKTLVTEQKERGRYTVQFDASTLASGMYVYQIRANDFTATKKMMLLK